MRLLSWFRFKPRIVFVPFLVIGMVTSNIEVPPASALDNMTLVVDYTPDSPTIANSVTPGNKIDLTATAPVAVAGTTQQEIVQDIGSQLRLSSTTDIIAPAGWAISYSTDGTTWTTTAPTTATGWNAVTKIKANGQLISQGADNNGRQIASTDANAGQPTTGQFPTTSGSSGDGWDVFFDDGGRLYNVWHHNGGGSNQSMDCYLRSGVRCNGTWPYLLTSGSFTFHTNEQSTGVYDPIEKEIWFSTVYTAGGVNQVGFACVRVDDINLTNKWCGGSAASAFVSAGAAGNIVGTTCMNISGNTALYTCTGGLAISNGRLFSWHVSTGDLMCVDIRANGGAGAPCSSGGLIDFGGTLTDVSSTLNRWRPLVLEWGGRIYGNGGRYSQAVCIEAATGNACAGWTNPRTISNRATRIFQLPTSVGGVAGVCFIALDRGDAPTCFDSSGTDITSTLTSNFKTSIDGTYRSTFDAYGGILYNYQTRLYWGDGGWNPGTGKIYCWDFGTNAWCRNWTSSGIADTNYQIVLDPYNPNCLWSNSHDGIIQTYDTFSGAMGNCAVPAPTAVFDAGVVVPRMACSSVDAIQGWLSFVLNTSSSYTSATLTVKNAAGTAISGWTNIAIPGNNTVDLSTLPIADSGQSPTFTVTFTGRTTNGDVSARITAVGGAPQLCLRPLAPLCPTGTTFTAGQFAATTTTVTADGNATAGATVTPLTQAAVNVSIEAMTPSLCTSSVSGTARDNAATPNAIAGATVTLTDSAGTTLNYPSDYGVTALRGQPITATTDASGNYSFPNIAPGAYKVSFRDVSTAEVISSTVTTGGSGTTTETTTAVTSLLSPVTTITTATPGVVNAVYAVMPTLTKRFEPATLAVGQVGSLIFTFTNAPGNPAKSGLGFVDTLPAGIEVDTNNNLMTTCPGGLIAAQNPTLNPAAMSTTTNTVTVTNASMNANVATCIYSVAVKATGAGTYTNGPSNVVTTGFKKDTNATLVATTPTSTGAFLCDANMYHITNKQLYRQSPNQSPALAYEIGPKLSTAVIDGIGFNSADGFIYGIVTTSGDGLTAGHLVRYGSNGVPTSMGAITGSMTLSDLQGIRGGDTDDAGNLIVSYGASRSYIWSIDLATRISTTVTLSTSINSSDLAYSNGKLYSLAGNTFTKITKDAAPDYVWAATTITAFSNTVSGDAIWSNGFGEVIVTPAGGSFSRTLYRTSNPSAAAATADFSLMFSIQTEATDGAMCHSSPNPTAFPDTSSGPLNTAQTKNLLTNDTTALSAAGTTSALVPSTIRLCDPNLSQTAPNCTVAPGSTITVTNVGTYSVSDLGVMTFTPANGYTGTPPPLGYQVADGNGKTGNSTYTPTVSSTTPVASNDTSSGPYDTNQVIDLVANDIAGSLYPLDDASIKLCPVGTPDNGCLGSTLTVPNEGIYSSNPDGTVTFDPYPSFKGTATPIKYTILDTSGQLTSATITPSVTAPAVPVAGPETKSVIPGGTVTFTTVTGTGGLATAVAGFNTSATCLITPASNPATCDADGVVDIPGQGTYTLNTATGVVTYEADPDAIAGTKTAITYQVTDVTGQKATSTLTPVVPPAPTADDETSTGAYDTNQVIEVLTGDAAGAGATLVPSSVKLCATTSTAKASCDRDTLDVAGEGTYTVNPNGTVTFNPLQTFTGTASLIKYVVADSTTQLAEATIQPTVTAPATPVANPESRSVLPGATATFTTTTGASGLATAAAGFNTSATCLITPASNPATCDADGVVEIFGQGTYTLNTATGVVTYVADAAATAGTKTAITYQVTDITGQKATSTLTPTIPPPPTADNETSTGPYNTAQEIDVLTGDAAGAGATLVPSSVKLCATTSTAKASCNRTTLEVAGEGTYTVNANGSVTFVPLSTFTGQASLVKYVVADSTTQLAEATIQPTVAMPAPPTATANSQAVIPGGTVAFTTITGASGLASSVVGLTASATCLITPGSSPDECDADGVVEVAGVGTYTLNTTTGVVTLVADPAATQGTKTALKYRVTDTFGQTATSTLTPVIPAPPTAGNDTSSDAYDTNQIIVILTNDAATAPASLVATSVKLCATTSTAKASCNRDSLEVAGEGTYTVNANGTVTFNPLPSFTGTASPVKYVVADSTTQLAEATIQPTVAMPDPPTATANSQAVIPGGMVSFTTITGASGLASSVVGLDSSLTCLITPGSSPESCEIDGVVEVSGVGTYTLNTATGVVTLVADPAATQGTKTALKYRVTDIFGQTATSTLTPVIPAPPDAVDDVSSGPYNTSQVIEVLTNDLVTSPATLVPGSVKLCATTGTANASCNLPFLDVPNEGRYTANANGTVTFVPLSTFKGQASPVKYVVTDSTGQITDALITVTVNNPGTPTAVNDSNVGPYDTVQAITILSNDTAGDAVLPLLSSTIKLCPVAATAPFTTTNCSLVPTQAAPLVTADGSYWVDTATGRVYFDPLPTFTGQVTQPVRYIALDAFNQIATATITPEVTPPLLPTASPQSRIVVPGSSVSFTTITGASGLATGAVLQTSGSTATCLYTPNTTSCELDNEVVIVGEGTFRLDPATGIVTFTAASNAPAGNRTAITYRVTDILGNSATSTLTPIVPPPATMNPDQSTNNWDTNQTLTPLSNDIATSGTSFVTSSLKLCAVGESSATGSCSLLTLTVANEGIYKVEANGSVVFDPLPTFTGTATPINYQVTDSYGRTAGSSIAVVVTPPALPVATAQTKVVGPGMSVSYTNVIGSSALATGAALQTGSVNGPCLIDPANNSCVASLTIAGEGTWTIDRNSGVATFASLNTITPGTKTPVTYRVTDVLGNSTTSTLTPVVPEPPVVTNDEKTDAWDTNQIFSPFANDKFASVAPVVLSSLKLCGKGEQPGSCTRIVLSVDKEGTYKVNADGTVTFDPLPTFHGVATPVTYQATDIAGQILHATIHPVVTPPPIPEAQDDAGSAKQGRSVVMSPWLNDFAGTPPENVGGKISLIPSSIRLCGVGETPPNCTLTKLTTVDGKYTVDIKTGKVTFVPRSGFSGTVTQPVRYQILNDWSGLSGQAVATALLIPTITPSKLPTTGLDDGVILILGGLTCGTGVGLWQISKGRRRGEYQLPRWLDEIDGE
jgi:CshA-type fibril repeat protein